MQGGYIELPCQCNACMYNNFWRNYQMAAETQNHQETIVVEVCDRCTQTDPVNEEELETNYEAHWTPGSLEHVVLQQEILKAIDHYKLTGAKDSNCNSALADILAEVKLPDTEETRRKLRLRISRTISFSRFYNKKRAEAQNQGTRLQDLLYNGNRKRRKRSKDGASPPNNTVDTGATTAVTQHTSTFSSNEYSFVQQPAAQPLTMHVPGTIPETAPGTITGTITGTVPGTITGTVPGTITGTVPGTIPGTVPGTIPGTIPGSYYFSPSRLNITTDHTLPDPCSRVQYFNTTF